jgi:hypothetical protein
MSSSVVTRGVNAWQGRWRAQQCGSMTTKARLCVVEQTVWPLVSRWAR